MTKKGVKITFEWLLMCLVIAVTTFGFHKTTEIAEHLFIYSIKELQDKNVYVDDAILLLPLFPILLLKKQRFVKENSFGITKLWKFAVT